jgi:tetratricopeptide (TPR) repeat protein
MENEKSLENIKIRITELDKEGYDLYLEAEKCFIEGCPLKTIQQFLDQALGCFDEERNLILEIGQDPKDLAESLSEVAAFCQSVDFGMRAKTCYINQLSIYSKLIEQRISASENTEHMALTHGFLGDIFAQEGESKTAIRHYNAKIELLTKLSNNENDTSYDLDIGNVFYQMGMLQYGNNTSTALNYLSMALEQYEEHLPDNTKNPEFLSDMFFVVSKIIPLYDIVCNEKKVISTTLIAQDIIDASIKLMEDDESNTIALPEQFKEFLESID